MEQVAPPGVSGPQIEKLSHVVWSDPLWLAYNQITRENVLSYFCRSPFYESSCNNELVRMQLEPQNQGGNLSFTPREERLLRGMQGLEFVPERPSNDSDLFIIRRQVRYSPEEAHVTNVYYVLHGSIYETPCFATVMLVRILQSTNFLLSSLTELYDLENSSTPFEGGSKESASGSDLTLRLLMRAQSRSWDL
ncbi:hypothetical protein CCYA_CCYA01G0243 [Cyanidiococcus yangmingshanensis]|nr:hypothetical protein CCYA_CCYA01G0243 [Cyanidiococcus yangmingshanensis]